MKLFLFALLLFGLVDVTIQCGPPGPGSIPLGIDELARRAPIVIRAYLVRKFGQPFINATRCFHVTKVYKGAFNTNSICATGFGSGDQCLSDVNFNQEYIIFLNERDGYKARYDQPRSAVRSYTPSQEEKVTKGLCCGRGQDCNKVQPCSASSACGLIQCGCVYRDDVYPPGTPWPTAPTGPTGPTGPRGPPGASSPPGNPSFPKGPKGKGDQSSAPCRCVRPIGEKGDPGTPGQN